MNPILAPAVFAEKRGAAQPIKRSSSESLSAMVSMMFAHGNFHINGIESFWSYAK